MAIGLTFSERMEGPFALGPCDPEAGADAGGKEGTELAMPVTVHIDDIDRFVEDPDHGGELTGAVDFTPWGQNMPAKGRFNLFSPADEPLLKFMIYEVGFEHEGASYYAAGRKKIRKDSNLDLWKDTTTLFTRLHRGTGSGGEVIGAGVLTLGVVGLAKLVSSLRATGAANKAEQAKAVAAFGRFFMGELWDTYAPHWAKSS